MFTRLWKMKWINSSQRGSRFFIISKTVFKIVPRMINPMNDFVWDQCSPNTNIFLSINNGSIIYENRMDQPRVATKKYFHLVKY